MCLSWIFTISAGFLALWFCKMPRKTFLIKALLCKQFFLNAHWRIFSRQCFLLNWSFTKREKSFLGCFFNNRYPKPDPCGLSEKYSFQNIFIGGKARASFRKARLARAASIFQPFFLRKVGSERKNKGKQKSTM